MAAQAVASKRLNEKWIGKKVRVLVESSPSPQRGEDRGEGAIARTQGQAPEIDGLTYVRNPKSQIPVPKVGEFVEVEIVDAGEYDLEGYALI